MDNPARVLHTRLSAWREKAAKRDRATMRAIVDPSKTSGMLELTSAVSALLAIRDLLSDFSLNSGYSVEVFQRQYPGWWAPVLALRSGWNSTLQPDDVVTRAELDEIEGFANFLDGKLWLLNAASERSLRNVIDQAQKLIEVDETLSPELRTYIHRLVRVVRDALDDEAVGETFKFDDAIQRLFVAFKAAEAEHTPSSSVWRELWTQFVPATLGAALVEAGSLTYQALSASN